MKSVEKMKAKWLLATILVVFLAAVVTTTQIHSAKGATTRTFTLYGSYNHGWGFTASSITSPGPTIVVEQGDTVNLTLINNDGIYANPHRFFVSYTNASSPNSTEPQSSDFTTTLSYQFVATNTVGTYTYGCVYHYSMMKGYFQVMPTGTIPEFQPLIMLSLLVVSATAAVLVHKRKRQI
jgi:FtsP/CotA-like multicopper oxidase with cupredoxin domain